MSAKRIIICTLLIFILVSTRVKASVYINEVMPFDSNGDSWVELYSDKKDDLSNYILTTNYSVEDACNVTTNNNYVYSINDQFGASNYLVLPETTISFLTDLSLYLVSCNEKDIVNSLFIPIMDENYVQARVYDGSSQVEERNYNLSENNTKGESNTTKPVIQNLKLDKSIYTSGQMPVLTFDLKAVESTFEGIKVYLNGYLIKNFTNYLDNYSYEVTAEDYFFAGSNLLKVVSNSSVGTNSYFLDFVYNSTNPTIKINTINTTSFANALKISGVVSSNTNLVSIALYYKKDGTSSFKEFSTTDLLSEKTSRKVFNFNFLPEDTGKYTLKFVLTDSVTSVEALYNESVVYDPNAPELDLNIDPKEPDGDNDFYTSTPKITLEANDSDVSYIYYRWGGDSSWTAYKEEFEGLEGENTLYYKTTDAAGNVSDIKSKLIKVDTVIPDAYIELYPKLPDGLNGFYLEKPEIVFKSSYSDIDKYEYSFNKKDWQEYTGDLKAESLETRFYYRSIDKASNKSETYLFNLKTALEKPSVVRSISYRIENGDTVYIDWKDYESDEAYLYEIYRSEDPNVSVSRVNFYAAVPSTQDYYIDTKVESGKTYYYLLIKKGTTGSLSDPVRIQVSIPMKSKVLGARDIAESMMFMKDGPVVKSEKPFELSPSGDVLGAKTKKFTINTLLFFVSLAVSVFLFMKMLYKLRLGNAS